MVSLKLWTYNFLPPLFCPSLPAIRKRPIEITTGNSGLQSPLPGALAVSDLTIIDSCQAAPDPSAQRKGHHPIHL